MSKTEVNESGHFQTFGEAMAEVIRQEWEAQEKIGYHFWRGCTLRFGQNQENYQLYLRFPAEVAQTAQTTIESFLSSAKQYIEHKEWTKPSLAFTISEGSGYYLNDANLKPSEEENEKPDLKTIVGSDAAFKQVGRISWGVSGISMYETNLYVPAEDFDRFVQDMDAVIRNRENIEKLTAIVPVGDEVIEFSFRQILRRLIQ